MNAPIYTISLKTIDLVARIAEKLGEIRGSGEYNRNLRLRKINRLRSIQSSLAIENNTLSLGQVTDIIDGKKVLGLPHEIQEAKNAYRAYEHLLEYAPYKVKDFLKAHQLMTVDLVKDAGHFRSQGVGVFEGTKLIHAGASYQFVPQLVTDLLSWAKKSDVHPLIKSSIVHFEIEFIHPFMDGNGRIGRLWQTLILSQWNELFAWLPVETVVYENQQDYYNALQTAGRAANSEIFIEFMLNAILQALEELPNKKITDIFTDIFTDKLSKTELEFLEQIAGYLDKNGEITNYRAQLLTNKSDISVKKYFARLVEIGLLEVEGKNKGRKYTINKKQ
ncbi:Fic family protein [Fluviicola sp.]|jgi:Fic family protein|uniref:Fic family protein n=1 Tax=Fluviicola sp. TaxID=1917219 RepID=UPI0028220688|nr:Fic family protein [Fluviicola sp.]MDR0802749.1 Fic family protein [Fluviicola sp.]